MHVVCNIELCSYNNHNNQSRHLWYIWYFVWKCWNFSQQQNPLNHITTCICLIITHGLLRLVFRSDMFGALNLSVYEVDVCDMSFVSRRSRWGINLVVISVSAGNCWLDVYGWQLASYFVISFKNGQLRLSHLLKKKRKQIQLRDTEFTNNVFYYLTHSK